MTHAQAKTVLVLSFSDLKRDPRVWRQLNYFKNQGYSVTAVGDGDPEIEGVEFLSCQVPEELSTVARWQWRIKRAVKTLLRQFDSIYWSHPKIQKARSLIENRSFDLILANDLDTLPLAVQAKKKAAIGSISCKVPLSEAKPDRSIAVLNEESMAKAMVDEEDRSGKAVASESLHEIKPIAEKAKLFFDAHEYAPNEFEDVWRWRLIVQPYRYFLCRKYIKEADVCLTVCQGIADEYLKEFQVPFHVMTNAIPKQHMSPQPLVNGKIRMIYHGCVTPSRSVEDVLAIMRLLDARFELDMILVPGSHEYIQKIQDEGRKMQNVRFLNPVPMQEIAGLCNRYDIGFFPLKPINLNYFFGLPNKFFEFIQARIVPAVSPLPEMKRYIDQYQMGMTPCDFTVESFAKALNALDADTIWKMKQNTRQAAEALCAEENYKLFDRLIKTKKALEARAIS